MGIGFSTFAQSHINIELLGATYTAPAVQFRVSWNSIPTVTGQTHNSKVWVWVDFLKLNADNTTAGNTWTRAEISAIPVVSSSPASTAALDASTNKGFWLHGVSGSYSATVTALLSNSNIPANAKFNWCAYASDCPPFVIADNGTYTLQGTPPFVLKAADETTQTVMGKTLPAASLTIAAVTLTDKTECPGDFCPYTGSDLYRDATHLCGHRPTGARNWEAWIQDTRDDELYRIVFMPDNNWWLAQNVKYEGTGYEIIYTGCTKDSCGRWYSNEQANDNHGGTSGYGANIQGVCPNDWVLPVYENWTDLLRSIDADMMNAIPYLRSDNNPCGPNNLFGWASYYKMHRSGHVSTWGDSYLSNDCEDAVAMWDRETGNCYWLNLKPAVHYESNNWRVRCFRQL